MTHCSLKNLCLSPAPVSPQIGIDISYVRVLPTITATTDTFPVDDYFAPAIQEWMLYSIWGSDDEQSPNYGAAQGHLQTFLTYCKLRLTQMLRPVLEP